MNAIFLSFAANPTHRLTTPLSASPRERAGATGRLVELVAGKTAGVSTLLTGASLAAIAAAHGIEDYTPPAPARRIGSREFIARIPDVTWAKVQTVRTSATPLGVALDKALLFLAAGDEVHSDNAGLLQMLDALVSAEVLTADERTQILGF